MVYPDDPKLKQLEHVLGDGETWKDNATPYIIHGDAATVTKFSEGSIISVRWKSLLLDHGAGASWFWIFPVLALCKSARVTPDSGGADPFEPLSSVAVYFFND